MSINYTAASEKAKKYLQKNQIDRAITLWTDFLPDAVDNDAANALNNLGDLCVRKKNTVAAIDHFLKASQAFENAGFPLKAIATLKKVLKLDPDRTEVYLRLGDLNARRDMIGNAVEAYLHVARLLVAEGERAEALNMVQKICILDPVNTRHRLQLAAELFELGFTEQAIDETVNAVDLFLQSGNLEEAERYCRHLLDLEPGCVPAQERLERIAHWGASDAPAADAEADAETSIDDLFAELDMASPPAPAAEPAPDAEAPASETSAAGVPVDAAEPPGPEGDVGLDTGDLDLEAAPEPEAPSDGSDLRDLLEHTSQAMPEDDAVAAAFGAIPLEATSHDAGPDDDPATLRRQAGELLGAGDLGGALDLLDRLADAYLAQDDPQAADAAMADYLAIDPDNPRAYEIRLRIVEGRMPDAEHATLERLVALHRAADPDRAHALEARLAALDGAEAPEGAPRPETESPSAQADPGDFMSIPLSELSLAGGEPAEADQAPEAEAEPDSEWSIDLTPASGADEITDIGAADTEAAGADDAPEGADDALDMSALDLTASFRDEAPAPEAEASTIDLDAGAEQTPEAAAPEMMPGLEIGGPGQEPPAESGPGGFDAKESLTEGRFYERQGLTQEAIQVYRAILEHDPGNPDATERLSALGAAPQQAPAAPPAAGPAPHAAGPTEGAGSDEFLNFTEEIENTIEKEVAGSWRQVSEEAQFDEILSAFRKGIQAEVSDDDAETHYDLGLAYHEMGLTEEAIGEFQLAVKGATRFADATIMLARCFGDVGKEKLAVGRLRSAVSRADCGEEAWISLAYELATLLENLGEKEEARQMYEEVYSRDINYRDVAKRVASLG